MSSFVKRFGNCFFPLLFLQVGNVAGVHAELLARLKTEL